MKEAVGDIWELAEGQYVGIPTNQIIKYQTPRGELVMGAGLALAAKRMFPEVPVALAARIRTDGNMPYDLGVWCREVQGSRRSWGLVSVPTKNHWRERSDLSLIRMTLLRLQALTDDITRQIFLPRLGCGNGGLDWRKDVRPMMQVCGLSDQFTIVHLEADDIVEDLEGQRELF